MSEDRYWTSDFATAAFLLTSGVKIRGMRDSDRGRGQKEFGFENPDECRALEKKHRLGDDMVSASEYVASTTRLKSLLFDNPILD